jgi:hypothetical protein
MHKAVGWIPSTKKKKKEKEMHNVPGHKGNANQNHIKILPQPGTGGSRV